MSILYDPNTLAYAVVEYLKSSQHIYDPVDGKPELEGQYRLVCLAGSSEDAWRIAHLLRAVSDGRAVSDDRAASNGNPASNGTAVSDNNPTSNGSAASHSRPASDNRAPDNGRYWYSVCLAEAETVVGEPLPLIA
jgi:hypothetical protein